MSDLRSALDGARYQGIVTVEEAGLRGMITLRGDPAAPALAKAVKAATGQPVPGRRAIVFEGERGVAWMASDEVLVMVPYGDAQQVAARLRSALAEEFALVAEVSDARAVFRVEGAQWRDVLAKLSPVDFAADTFAEGEIRRTRAAQVAAAVWQSGPQEATLVCFRSVGHYMFDLLSTAARPGGEVGLY